MADNLVSDVLFDEQHFDRAARLADFRDAQCVMPATVRTRSQSASTIAASLPPISTLDGMPRSAHCRRTSRPVFGEPVNAHASMPASISAAPRAVAVDVCDQALG